ncbi:MAG: 2-C-methyl-D-erythritol 4-phosphate cytidylyltransferase [Terriglobia bacterium]
MNAVAIVPAAGLGIRMGTEQRKPLLELEGVPILIWTLRKLAACPRLRQLFVALRKQDFAAVETTLGGESYRARVTLVEGGDYRQDSVVACLARLPADTDLVVIHDAVRPFVDLALVEKVMDAAAATGAAIAALPITDTVKQIDRTRVSGTLPRERIVLAQTPQAFRYALLKEAFARAAADGYHGTDEAVLVERLGREVRVVAGSDRNLKITKPADLELARFLLAQERTPGAEK